MRSLGRQFNMPSVEELVYFSHIGARVIDSHSPQGEFHGHGHSFSFDVVQPVGHDLNVWWQLGFDVIPGSEGRFIYDLCELQLQPGEYVLIAKAQDDTPWVRDEQKRMALFGNVWWNIVIDTPPADRTADGIIDFADLIHFLNDYSNEDPMADLAEPFGEFDFWDVSEYLRLFTEVCPTHGDG